MELLGAAQKITWYCLWVDIPTEDAFTEKTVDISLCTRELEKMLEEKAELHKEIEFIIECRWKSDIDFYAFLRENVQALEQLYKWALGLPDFKGK